MNRKNLEKECDALWSEAVKAVANYKCEVCATQHNLESHHFFVRQHRGTRWNIENGVCLCVDHHTKNQISAHRKPRTFSNMMIERRGADWFDKMSLLAHSVTKFDVHDLIEIRDSLKKIIKNPEVVEY